MAGLPGLRDHRIRQLVAWWLDRAEAERQRTGTIPNAELDAKGQISRIRPPRAALPNEPRY